jgi:hypothetical protein
MAKTAKKKEDDTMPMGKGTYKTKVGRPAKKTKKTGKK